MTTEHVIQRNKFNTRQWKKICTATVLLLQRQVTKDKVFPAHAMNAHRERRGAAPLIHNLGSRWRWAVNFAPRSLCPRERNPGTHWIGGWVGPRAGMDGFGEEKISCSCRDSNHERSISYPCHHTDYAILLSTTNINIWNILHIYFSATG